MLNNVIVLLCINDLVSYDVAFCHIFNLNCTEVFTLGRHSIIRELTFRRILNVKDKHEVQLFDDAIESILKNQHLNQTQHGCFKVSRYALISTAATDKLETRP